jgi:hypothetical protein
MVKRSEVFPSKFLKAADLGGKPREVEIKRAPQEELGSGDDKEIKTVLYFNDGVTKPLPLNMTNWDSVAAIAGDDTIDWPGHCIELYPDKTLLRGVITDCIRIRPPRQKDVVQKPQPLQQPRAKVAATAAADNSDMDDDIPF